VLALAAVRVHTLAHLAVLVVCFYLQHHVAVCKAVIERYTVSNNSMVSPASACSVNTICCLILFAKQQLLCMLSICHSTR
jgi:hypothetical protein